MLTAEILLVAATLTLHGQDLRQDVPQLATANNGFYSAAGLALAGGAFIVKDDLRSELDDAALVPHVTDYTNIYGSSSFNLPLSLGIQAVGAAAGSPDLSRFGSRLTRTLALVQVAVAPLKLATRRTRPDGSNRLSFPSGHTANTFAVARLIQRDYGNAWSAPFYLVAGCTGLGRMEHARHYLSDVVMGAAIGLMVGSAIGVADGADNRLQMYPRTTAGGWRIEVAARW